MLSTIGIIIDIAVVLVLVIFALIGLKKGLFKTVLSLFSWVVCLAIAIFTAKYVAGWINGIYNFSGLIGGGIEKGFTNSNAFFGTAVSTFNGDKAALFSAIPTEINGFVRELIHMVFNSVNLENVTADATVGAIMGSTLGHICMVVISGILVFIVLKIVVALLSKLFENIEKIKILGGLNKVLGLALGLIKGGLIIFAINFALVGLTLIPPVNNVITPIIQDHTYVENFIYDKTDELFGKYIVEGNVIQDFISNLWENR